VFWPSEEERKEIAARIRHDFDWPNCNRLIDGTLFPLAFTPQTIDAPDYSGRKYGYSLTCLIMCDDQRLIRYYLAGWPGSAHDERVFRKTKLFRNPLRFSRRRSTCLETQHLRMSGFLPALRLNERKRCSMMHLTRQSLMMHVM
jgi:hypothetical protein